MNIPAEIQRIIAGTLGIPQADIKPESRLVEDLGTDSFDVIEIGMNIAKDLGIEIPDKAVAAWDTVQSIINSALEYNQSTSI